MIPMSSLSYEFAKYPSPKGIILRPMIPVRLRYKGYQPLDTLMLVDSGADFSMISREFADNLGINTTECSPIQTSTASGRMIAVETEIRIRFGQRREIYDYEIPVQIPLRKGFPELPLLGRYPLFRDFDVNFRMGYCQSRGKFVIKRVTRRRPDSDYR